MSGSTIEDLPRGGAIVWLMVCLFLMPIVLIAVLARCGVL